MEYPNTVPYVYCGLAEASYDKNPLDILRDKYETNIDRHINIKERQSEKGWDYMLFENTQNNTLVVAFRGTELKRLTEDIEDVLNELSIWDAEDAKNNAIVRGMSKTVSIWLNKHKLNNNNKPYDEVTFVGHSEGGLFARFVLSGDPRIKHRITFNTAKPEHMFNFRTKNDPISWITGPVERDVKKLLTMTRGPIDDAVVWTVCDGEHGIHYFRKKGVLIDEDNRRKTWQQVKCLMNNYKDNWAYLRRHFIFSLVFITVSIIIARKKK
eukprot:236483_1